MLRSPRRRLRGRGHLTPSPLRYRMPLVLLVGLSGLVGFLVALQTRLPLLGLLVALIVVAFDLNDAIYKWSLSGLVPAGFRFEAEHLIVPTRKFREAVRAGMIFRIPLSSISDVVIDDDPRLAFIHYVTGSGKENARGLRLDAIGKTNQDVTTTGQAFAAELGLRGIPIRPRLRSS